VLPPVVLLPVVLLPAVLLPVVLLPVVLLPDSASLKFAHTHTVFVMHGC
jgi:hypothetical protein